MNRAKLISFLNTSLLTDGFTRLELRHLNEKGGACIWDAKRGSVRIGEDDEPAPVDVEDLATQIESAAYDDAEGIGGMQRYCVLAFVAKEKAPRRRFTFRMLADEEDDSGAPSEEPTAKGHLTQLMRHNEALMRTVQMAIGSVLTNQSRTIESQAQAIADADKRRLAMFETHEQLLSRQADRDLEREKFERQEEMVREGFELGKALFPTIVNKVTGKPLLPETTTPGYEAIRKVFASMTESEQGAMMQFMMSLRPSNRIALQTFIEAMMAAEDEAEKKESGDAANGNAKERFS